MCVTSADITMNGTGSLKSVVSNLADAGRTGGSHTAKRADANAEVERMIQGNRRITVDEVVRDLKVSHDSAHHIINEVPNSLRQVPKQLIPGLK